MTCSFLVLDSRHKNPIIPTTLMYGLSYCAKQIDKDIYEVFKNRFDSKTGLISYDQHIQNLLKCLKIPEN